MVQIRLSRYGTKKAPFYRVVVAEKRRPRDGRFIEHIGTFDPSGALAVDDARLDYWKKQGAQLSHTLDRLLKKQARDAKAAPKS
jgi:small subunit ribosomal protein S16